MGSVFRPKVQGPPPAAKAARTASSASFIGNQRLSAPAAFIGGVSSDGRLKRKETTTKKSLLG